MGLTPACPAQLASTVGPIAAFAGSFPPPHKNVLPGREEIVDEILALARVGITREMIRLFIGLVHIDDIIEDIDQALDA